jgi:hypothetical protein
MKAAVVLVVVLILVTAAGVAYATAAAEWHPSLPVPTLWAVS